MLKKLWKQLQKITEIIFSGIRPSIDSFGQSTILTYPQKYSYSGLFDSRPIIKNWNPKKLLAYCSPLFLSVLPGQRTPVINIGMRRYEYDIGTFCLGDFVNYPPPGQPPLDSWRPSQQPEQYATTATDTAINSGRSRGPTTASRGGGGGRGRPWKKRGGFSAQNMRGGAASAPHATLWYCCSTLEQETLRRFLTSVGTGSACTLAAKIQFYLLQCDSVWDSEKS